MNYPFRILNIRTAQDSDVEHIVQGNFRSFNFCMMLYKYEISTIRKLPAILYLLYSTAQK